MRIGVNVKFARKLTRSLKVGSLSFGPARNPSMLMMLLFG
jgi:hypothetical protein